MAGTELIERIENRFVKEFNLTPLVVRSPGRVNLIGEHTDYNEGFVMPAAIDKEIIVAVSRRDDLKCKLISQDLDDRFEFDVFKKEKTEKEWPNYIMGVVDVIQKLGLSVGGFNCVIGGSIPIGAGLSSSAAVECCTAYALNEIFQLGIEKLSLARIAQRAENDFVGVRCGIMDQFASLYGKEDHVIKLDCRSLAYEYFPFKLQGIKVVLYDTQVKHSLASSEYNTRRAQCEAGVKLLKTYYPEIYSLRDVSLDMLHACRNKFDPDIYKRCDYVVRENMRLLSATESLLQNDLYSFGQRMYETHEGLQYDYEVSSPEQDFLVQLAKKNPNVLGARMMGGGFGGCTINLIKEQGLGEFNEKVAMEYQKKTGFPLQVYIVQIKDGTSIVR